MLINIHSDICRRYPEYLMGVMEIIIAQYDIEKLHQAIIIETHSVSLPSRNAEVEAKWLQVFADMNASEKRLPSVISLWNLQERFSELRSINYFVDAYNHISTKHGIPMGGYDVAKLPADDITLRFAKKGDKFQPLGLNQIEKIKDENEIVYYSGNDVICRYWNNKDSEMTKVTENTTKLVVIFDFFGNLEDLRMAMNDFEKLLNSTSDMKSHHKSILSATKPSVSTELF